MGEGAAAAWCALAWALAALAGVALQLQQRALCEAAVAWGLIALALLLVLGAWRWRHVGAAAALIALGCALLGFASTDRRAAVRLSGQLPAALEGRDAMVTGIVAELPRSGPNGTRFVFETESATLPGVPRRLSLGWYRIADADELLAGPGEALRAGQRWRLPVRLRAVHGSLNPHGFDLELWAFERGLGGSGYVRGKPGSPAVKLAEDSGRAPVERMRQAVRDAIVLRVDDSAAAGVLAALAVGDQAAIVVAVNKGPSCFPS